MKKKILAMIFAVFMITAMFSGCTGEPEPLRIVVDLDYLGYEFITTVDSAANGFAARFAEVSGIEDVVIECVPGKNPERDAALTRLRAEIMSGEGPDVFIMGCAGGYYSNTGDPFFAIPEKALANGTFLPLDEYIENNAQFTDWDKLLPQVMEAGRDKYGQQIVPLSYTIPVTVFKEADVPDKFTIDTTWQNMLDDKTGILSAASTWFHSDGTMLMDMEAPYLENTFGSLADYNTDKLLFTEEELIQRLKEVLEQHKQYREEKFPVAPVHYQTLMRVDYDQSSENITFGPGMNPYNGIEKTDELTMVPIYSEQGGVTANVITYAAVNVNTERPEDSFAVIDYLLSLEEMKSSQLYWYWLTGLGAVPVHTEAMNQSNPMVSRGWGRAIWFMRDSNFEEFARVREQITHTRFRGGLDIELKWLYFDCQGPYVYGMPSSSTLEENVHEYYRRMLRLLGE